MGYAEPSGFGFVMRDILFEKSPRYGMNLHKFLLDYCTFVHYIITLDVARQWLSCPLTP